MRFLNKQDYLTPCCDVSPCVNIYRLGNVIDTFYYPYSDGLELLLDSLLWMKLPNYEMWYNSAAAHPDYAFGIMGGSGVHIENNYFVFDGSSHISNSSNYNFNYLTHTIEVVYYSESANDRFLLYVPKSTGQIAFGALNNTQLCIATTSTTCVLSCPNGLKGLHTISAHMGFGLMDIDNQLSFASTSNSWTASSNENRIGVRTQGTYQFKGKIYAIRIYNRRLTIDEMRRNQIHDKLRFKMNI